MVRANRRLREEQQSVTGLISGVEREIVEAGREQQNPIAM